MDGEQGPPGVTFLNGTNLYRVNSASTTTTGNVLGNTATATCVDPTDPTDLNDFAISGDALVTNNQERIDDIFSSEPTTSGNGWVVTIEGPSANPVTFQAVAICFDNP
jgi:hypothetical protein